MAAKDKPRRRGPSTAAKIKDAVSKATKGANGRARKYKGQVEAVVGRRNVEAAEVVAGGMAAGGTHGAGVSVDIPIGEGKQLEVPVGLFVGGAAVIGGAMLKDKDAKPDEFGLADDAQALGLGMFTYGLGRVVEDVVKDALND